MSKRIISSLHDKLIGFVMWIFLLLTAGWLTMVHPPEASAQDAQPAGAAGQEVLILNSYHSGYAWSDDEQAGVLEALRGKNPTLVPFIEYLDLKHFPGGKHLDELKRLLGIKYHDKKFSVIIALDNPALDFALENQSDLLANAPIVFGGINNYEPSLLKGHTNVTGAVEAIDMRGTIEMMLRVHPHTREIFSPHDYTATGLAVRKELEKLAPGFGVTFRFTDPMTMEELLK